MYFPGHMALGYYSGKITGRITKKNPNIILLWVVSNLPDIDIFIPGVIHRGPTHSVIFGTIIFIPIFLLYKDALPHYASLMSHSLIGDYFTAYGCQLFWPVQSTWYRYGSALQYGPDTRAYSISIELALFAIMVGLMIYEKYKPRNSIIESGQ